MKFKYSITIIQSIITINQNSFPSNYFSIPGYKIVKFYFKYQILKFKYQLQGNLKLVFTRVMKCTYNECK